MSAKLGDQLCFALYATSRAVTGAYREGLAALGLTYPQYVTLLSVWEQDGQTVGQLGESLDLDSGTLSPLLRRLEASGLVQKKRGEGDERTVRVYATAKSRELEPQVSGLRCDVEERVGLTATQSRDLRAVLASLRTRLEGGIALTDASPIDRSDTQ